jgi:hypothetical protein
MKCSQCGEEHSIEDMELTFLRPDDVASLSEEERGCKVQESGDRCIVEDKQFFIRALLPLPVFGREEPYCIGLWVEVEKTAFERIYELWSEPDQASEPPFSAKIANTIPILPNTVGLSAFLYLTGPSTRPNVVLSHEEHTLCIEQKIGITAHRAYEYTSIFT